MNALLAVVVPVLGLVVAGFVTGRTGLIPPAGRLALERVLVIVALPALLFRLASTAPVAAPGIWSFVLTFGFGTYCAFAIAFSVAALRNGGVVAAATVDGVLGARGRSAELAPAIVLGVFGVAAGPALALAMAVETVLLLAIAPLMVAAGGVERASARRLVRSTARRIVLHPVVLAVAAGLAVAAAGLDLPEAVDRALDLAGQAAPALGLLLVGLGLAQGTRLAPAADRLPSILVKLLLAPAIVYLLLGWVGDFAPEWVFAAMIVAAMPPATDALAALVPPAVVEEASSGLALAVLGSLLTLAALVALIVTGVLPADPFP